MKPCTGGIHIEGEIPAEFPPDEQKAMLAKAIATGLTAAAQSPEFRLRMILGEAYQRYLGLTQWLASEIEKDEARVPGLKAAALARAFDPISFRSADGGLVPQDVFDAQTALLEAAIGRPHGESPAVKTIEHVQG